MPPVGYKEPVINVVGVGLRINDGAPSAAKTLVF